MKILLQLLPLVILAVLDHSFSRNGKTIAVKAVRHVGIGHTMELKLKTLPIGLLLFGCNGDQASYLVAKR